jgi:hypothetical protein
MNWPAIFKPKIEKLELNSGNIKYLEDLISQDEYLDYKKMIRQIEGLMTALINTYSPLYDQLEWTNDKMVAYAKKNVSGGLDELNTIELLDAKMAHLRKSIDSMQPVVDKKDEVKNILVRNSTMGIAREIQAGILKSLPVLFSLAFTIGLDFCTPVFEKSIHDKSAHLLAILVSFSIETVIFDHLLDSLKEKIFKSLVLKDIASLRSDYTELDQVTKELKRRIDENPMPEIFE